MKFKIKKDGEQFIEVDIDVSVSAFCAAWGVFSAFSVVYVAVRVINWIIGLF